MRRRGSWGVRLADAATGAILLGALALLVRDRGLPALRERAVADPGEPVPAELLALDLARGDTVALRDTGPAALLAVLSTCSACERSSIAWREALGTTPGRLRLLLIGEPAEIEAAWAERQIPGAVRLLPLDREQTLRRLRIRAVPTVLAVSTEGVLLGRREGGVSAEEARRILATLEPRSAHAVPLEPRVRGISPDASSSTPDGR